jgi:transcription antitermination factor NusG
MTTQNLADVSRWVVVLTHAQAEWQAYTNLLRHGVDALLPYTIGSARRGRWQQGVIRPTYPGYLFAQLGNTEKIRKAVGVRDLLRAGDLVIVSDAEVETFRTRWLADYREAHPQVHRKLVLHPGDCVEVPSGPFIGMPAIVERVDKSGIVWASLGKLQVSFHLSDVAHKAVRGRAKPARTPKHRKPKPL